MAGRVSEPEVRASLLGHEVVADAPEAGTAERWTCVRCGDAVLRSGSITYGSAVDQVCPRTEPVDRVASSPHGDTHADA